jgi:hypothetical protein
MLTWEFGVTVITVLCGPEVDGELMGFHPLSSTAEEISKCQIIADYIGSKGIWKPCVQETMGQGMISFNQEIL